VPANEPGNSPQTPEALLELYRAHPDGKVWVDFDELTKWPVLCTGQADDLIAEDHDLRVWISRVALADLEGDDPSLNQGMTIGNLEWHRNGRWETVPLVVAPW
jgi:hypothetical protein